MVVTCSGLFDPVVLERQLSPRFQNLTASPAAEPARLMMDSVFMSYPDTDGNFVQQFQTTGFDSRVFELYLFAYLSDAGYSLDRSHPSPDFVVADAHGATVALEATTVNPTQSNSPQAPAHPPWDLSDEELQQKLDNELPIRFGSPLFSKLQMRYWELEHCRHLPLVLAIEAFHEEGSLFYSDNALTKYLYGLRHTAHWTHDGKLLVRANPIDQHQLGDKVIPSNFFNQPLAEHISAVIFSNSGTYSKFLRMGYQAGFHRGNLEITRVGHCYDPDPNSAKPFVFEYDLDSHPFLETWGQGLMVFHNPNALRPIPRDFFVDAARSYIDNDQLAADLPPFYPYMSITRTVVLKEVCPSTRGGIVLAPILKSEFVALPLKKLPSADRILQEREWYADPTQNVIGTVVLDLVDDDWSFVALQRDELGDFRPVRYAVSLKKREDARKELLAAMRAILARGSAA